MKCEICGKEILRDSQCINYKYYHNNCIENLQQENKQLKEKLDCDLQWAFKYDKQVDNWNKLKEYINRYIKYDKYGRKISKYLSTITIINKMQEIEQGSDNNEKSNN